MEKFMFCKKIENIPQKGICGLSHKHVTMIYSILLLVGTFFLSPLFIRDCCRKLAPFLILCFFSLSSILSFVFPSKNIQFLKVFYFFNIFLTYFKQQYLRSLTVTLTIQSLLVMKHNHCNHNHNIYQCILVQS